MDKPALNVLVLGLGNLLMSDDGLGIYMVEHLKQRDWPRGVTVLEAGMAVQNYYGEISRAHTVFVVDAVQAGGKPGDIYCLEEKSIAHLPVEKRFDAHGFSILQHLQLIRQLTGGPQLLFIYGVEPLDLSFGMHLSWPVAQAIPQLIDKITEDIKNFVEPEK